jgi:hypothetical protein
MTNFRLVARQFVIAAAIAGAIAVPPAVAAFAGAPLVVRTIADPPTCTQSSSGDSLDCPPENPPANTGAPNLETGSGSESQQHSGHH